MPAAWGLAEKYPDCHIIGLDIVTDTLERNRQKAKIHSNNNLSFTTYDGNQYPFEEESIDIVVSRYAIHHFPDLLMSICE